MGLSETILAAMIGAIATVSAALFQLFTAFKAKGKVDARPKRGLTIRSLAAVAALMAASAAGGFLYSEFLKQRSGEDIHAMREELQELRQSIVAQRTQAATAEPMPLLTPASMPASIENQSSTVESIVYVPACRARSGANVCEESEAQRVALCGTIPSFARAQRIELFSQPDAVQQAWDQHRVDLEQDFGNARFTGKSFEYAQSADTKAVCVNFLQWGSEHPQIARMVITYGARDFSIPNSPSASPDLQSGPTALATTTTALTIDSASAPAPLLSPAKPAL